MARMRTRTGHYMPVALLESQFATLERPDATEPVLCLRSDEAPDQLAENALAWLLGEHVTG
jgi:gluconokinase